MSEQNVQVTQADRELFADLFDLPGPNRRALLDGEYDSKPNIIYKLSDLARHRTRAEPDLVAAAHPITPAMIDRAAAAFDETRWNEDARTGVDAVKPAIEAALRAALEQPDA